MSIARMDENAYAEITLVRSCVIGIAMWNVPEIRCKIVAEAHSLDFIRCIQVSVIQLLQRCSFFSLLCEDLYMEVYVELVDIIKHNAYVDILLC